MKFICVIYLFLLLCTFSPTNGVGQEIPRHLEVDELEAQKYISAWLQKEYLTGNWFGARQDLIDIGLTPTFEYFTTVLGNPVGGLSKGVAYAGQLNGFLEFDLDKLLGLHGLKFLVSGSWATGNSLSDENIGNLFSASNVFGGRSIRLFLVYLEQFLLEGRLSAKIGRLNSADEFATSDIFNYYVNNAINSNPISININNPSFTNNPIATWGARVKVRPMDNLYAMVGAYNANERVRRNSAHGLDFTLSGGAFLIGELGYMHNQKKDSNGPPGNIKIGAYFDSGKFNDLSDPQVKKTGNYGIYVVLDQMIYQEGDLSSDQGLTPWATITLAPSDDINIMPFFFSSGLIYKGLFAGRENDTTAFGLAFGKISNDLEDKDFEMLLEFNYVIEVTPWLILQPDIQYIIHPGGSSEIENALVVGMMISVNI